MWARRYFAIVGLILFALLARAENIEIRSASVQLRDDSFSLDVDFEITLTPTLEDILGKGVPLNFLVEFELTRPRWYWLNDRIATRSQQYKLAYNPLTRQYRVSIGTFFQNFETLREAVGFMSRVRNMQVADRGALQPGTSYSAGVRLRLDVSQLPRPFQVTALGSRDWNLSSEWYRFQVSP